MDYKKELFAQYTPYLQWLHEQEIQEKSMELGKPGCMLPFSSCMEAVGDIIEAEAIEPDRIYIFANKDGRLVKNAEGKITDVFKINSKTALVYADEDYLGTFNELYGIEEELFEDALLDSCRDDVTGLFRGAPWFKPDFSPDTLHSFFYIGNIFALRGEVLKAVWQPRLSLYELVVRVVNIPALDVRTDIVHLSNVLFTNNTITASKELPGFGLLNHVHGNAVDERLVSIIIPSRNHSEILGRCLRSLTACTEDINYELIIVDNGSSDKEKICINQIFEELREKNRNLQVTYLYKEQAFNFSAMCNQGAQEAKGTHLLFLNDDIEIIKPDWLKNMLALAGLSHVGAVGAKLYYPARHDTVNEDGCYFIQHAGITNMGIGPAHKLGGMKDKGNLYHGHNLANYNMLAVTAACLLIKRDRFDLVGGFDEELAVAYNDVELCFKLYEAGFYNVLRNDAVLIHHESLSRGQDTSPEKQQRLKQEKQRLYEKHPDLRGKDPFYNPNLVQWKKDTEYNSSYLYACDRAVASTKLDDKAVKALPKEHTSQYIKKLTGEARLMLSIDSVEIEDMVTVKGWCVLREQDNSFVEKRLLLRNINNSSDIYELPIYPQLRTDVEALFQNSTERIPTINTALSGIQVLFEKINLPEGCYEIGVLTKNNKRYIKWSGQCFEI